VKILAIKRLNDYNETIITERRALKIGITRNVVGFCHFKIPKSKSQYRTTYGYKSSGIIVIDQWIDSWKKYLRIFDRFEWKYLRLLILMYIKLSLDRSWLSIFVANKFNEGVFISDFLIILIRRLLDFFENC